MAMASCDAFEAAYGLDGMMGDHSRCGVPPICGPYTSSVLTMMTWRGLMARASSSVDRATRTLFRTNVTGSRMLRSTLDSDAYARMASAGPTRWMACTLNGAT